MAENITLQSNISTSISSITGDAYLIIVTGNDREKYAVTEFPKKENVIPTNDLLNKQADNIQKSGLLDKVGKFAMAAYTAPITQNFLSKNFSSATLGRINSSLYDIMADGKISTAEVADDFFRSMTNILDTTALNMGLPSASQLYNIIKPNGTGLLSKDFSNLFQKFFKGMSNTSEKENKEIIKKQNENYANYGNVLKFRIITKDSETWSTDIPTRKTEKGIYLATLLGNQNKTKNFSISIVDNPEKNLNMYEVKDQLSTLRDSREPFDIYVCDSDVQKITQFKHCVFSNITLDTEGKNSLTVDISISIIPEYVVTIDTSLAKNLSGSKAGGTGNVKGSKRKDNGVKPKTTPNNVGSDTKQKAPSKLSISVEKNRQKVKEYERAWVNANLKGAKEILAPIQQKIDMLERSQTKKIQCFYSDWTLQDTKSFNKMSSTTFDEYVKAFKKHKK